jgi:hypothetical protein
VNQHRRKEVFAEVQHQPQKRIEQWRTSKAKGKAAEAGSTLRTIKSQENHMILPARLRV